MQIHSAFLGMNHQSKELETRHVECASTSNKEKRSFRIPTYAVPGPSCTLRQAGANNDYYDRPTTANRPVRTAIIPLLDSTTTHDSVQGETKQCCTLGQFRTGLTRS